MIIAGNNFAYAISLIRFIINVIPSPSIAITAKEYCKLASSAIKPISGGPIKKPKKPIPDTVAMAIPLATSFIFPAVLYINGMMLLTPKPTIRKPIVAVTIIGNKTAIIMPVNISTPLS